MFGEKYIAVRAANRTPVIQPEAGHFGGWAIAHCVPEEQFCRTKHVLCYYSVIVATWIWGKHDGAQLGAQGAGRGGGPLAQEEIKEEEICCSYVDQISERCTSARESVLKGTSVTRNILFNHKCQYGAGADFQTFEPLKSSKYHSYEDCK